MQSASSPPCLIPPRPSNLVTASYSEILHAYIIDDKADKVEEFLLENALPVDIRNKYKQTALFVAAYSGSENALVRLLQLGADPNKSCGGFRRYTPVHGACFGGSPRALSHLIEAGGDLRLRDELGRTPRDWAADCLNRASQRSILATIEYYREFAASGTSKEVGAFKKPILNHLSQIFRLQHSPHVTPGPLGQLQATGFGDVYFGQSVTMGFIQVRRIHENECDDIICKNDLESNRDIYKIAAEKAVSYRCGTITEYYPRRWKGVIVTVKKLIDADLKPGSQSSASQNILIAELENLRMLNAPGILHLLGAMPTQGYNQISLVFEKVQLGSLYRCMHEPPVQVFGREIKLIFLSQIANALKVVHNMGFVHLAVSSHSIHIVSPTQAKLGNFEFAINAQGEVENQAYIQRPWDVLKHVYWRWMSPEVMRKLPPTEKSDIFSFCMVVAEVFGEKLPWNDGDFKSVLKIIDRILERSEKSNERHPVVDVGLFPKLIQKLLRAGLDVKPCMRCDFFKIESMLEQQTEVISKAKKGIRPSLDQISSLRKISYRKANESDDNAEPEVSYSSQDRSVTAGDSGVFCTPELNSDYFEPVTSSPSRPFMEQKAETLEKKSGVKIESFKRTNSGDKSVPMCSYQSIQNSPAPKTSFLRRFSIHPRSKKNKMNSFDSADKLSLLPSLPKCKPVEDSPCASRRNLLTSNKTGMMKFVKRTPSKSVSTPPPMPKITREPRKPASHFSSPAVFVPPAIQDERRASTDNNNRYTNIPSDIKSAVVQFRKEFDITEWRRIIFRTNFNNASTQTEDLGEIETQAKSYQKKSSDQVKRYLQADFGNCSSRSCKESHPVTSPTLPRVGAIHSLAQVPCKKSENFSAGNYDDFSRGNPVETSSPITHKKNMKHVRFYVPGEVPRRPNRERKSGHLAIN
ncbi:inactive serine/threonine-protein kinase TEX14-like [Artemia franciscana]|uniref:Protein kinase domain-containing protein n=1 Tax=Artemia franciscana TaxID=6661 RepID=A0AA88I4T7_ARTSF|nr:hypothetical protein QYM36_010120 [Artemia franciscana]